MGTEIKCSEVMAEFGTTCSTCTPSLWESGKTPKYIFIVFAGLKPCPGAITPPNGVRFRLTQDPVFPQRWFVDTQEWDGYEWFATWGVGGEHVYLRQDSHAGPLHFYDWNPACEITGPNSTNCTHNESTNGQYCVFWEQDDIPRTINCDFKLNPISGTAFHRGVVDATHEVIRLNNRNGYTKCRVKVDTTEF